MLIEAFSGPEVARQLRRARAALRALEARDPQVAAEVRRRVDTALLGVAAVYAGHLPRSRIRQIARRSARLAWTEKLRTEGEAWTAFAIEDRDRLDAALAEGRGAIVAPLHFGAYRTIGPGLAHEGYRVAFLADAANIRFLGAELDGGLGAYADACAGEYGPLDGERLRAAMVLVDSTDLLALWRLRGALAENRVVVMFPDGNSGADGRPTDRHCVPVDFLGARIGVRAGIAALAALAGCPIVPAVMCDRGRDRPVLRLDSPIRRAVDEGRGAFRARAMGELFALLEDRVRRQPHRWEEWIKLGEWLVRTPRPLPASVPVPAHIGLGARLALDARVWVIDRGDGPQVVHVGTWNSLGRAPGLVALVEAAERGCRVGEWLDERPDKDAAAALLVDLISRGCVRVDGAR